MRCPELDIIYKLAGHRFAADSCFKPMNSQSNSSILSIIGGGAPEHRRFEQLVRPHYEMLYRVAFRFTGSEQDAEDLVQECCIRAYRQIAELEKLDNVRTWLLCVLRRLFIDQTRRYDRTHVTSLEATLEGTLADTGLGPAEETDILLLGQKVLGQWRKLDRKQRTLLALHDIEGYSLAELSEMTNIKIGTLKSRLHRARVKLGRLLRSEDDAGASKLGQRAQL